MKACPFSGQDLVYAVTDNKIKPIKHILLPLAMKLLLENVELIKILKYLVKALHTAKLKQTETWDDIDWLENKGPHTMELKIIVVNMSISMPYLVKTKNRSIFSQ